MTDASSTRSLREYVRLARRLVAPICLLLGVGGLSAAEQAGEMTLDHADAAARFIQRGYSPYADRGFPTQVLWGDTHLHTANSPDAFAFGNRLTPAEAYRFARGETVTSASGQRAQLSRPLDYLVVADHGVAMGAMMELFKGNPAFMKDEQLKRWHLMMNESPEQGVKAAGELIAAASQGDIPPAILDPTIARTVWQRYTKTADDYNDPGAFTAIIGYEWTSLIKGNNLHRVLMFRGDRSSANQIQPFTFADREALGIHGCLRGAHRRFGAGHPAQRQPFQRHDVQQRNRVRKPPEPRIRTDPGALGAGLRGHPDQG
jgi:hypothetical protein